MGNLLVFVVLLAKVFVIKLVAGHIETFYTAVFTQTGASSSLCRFNSLQFGGHTFHCAIPTVHRDHSSVGVIASGLSNPNRRWIIFQLCITYHVHLFVLVKTHWAYIFWGWSIDSSLCDTPIFPCPGENSFRSWLWCLESQGRMRLLSTEIHFWNLLFI